MASEQVLCFPAKILDKLGKPELFTKDIDLYLNEILKQENMLCVDRDQAEKDPSFKQLIPYQIIECRDKYFVYSRNKKGGENRLHAKLSLGIGGHINQLDCISDNPILNYTVGLTRELLEEISLGMTEYTYGIIGIVYDDYTEVGRVHFGVVHLYKLKDIYEFKVVDNTLDVIGWMTKEELASNKDVFEPWSKIVIDNLL